MVSLRDFSRFMCSNCPVLHWSRALYWLDMRSLSVGPVESARLASESRFCCSVASTLDERRTMRGFCLPAIPAAPPPARLVALAVEGRGCDGSFAPAWAAAAGVCADAVEGRASASLGRLSDKGAGGLAADGAVRGRLSAAEEEASAKEVAFCARALALYWPEETSAVALMARAPGRQSMLSAAKALPSRSS
jgi:hypothetical protein